MMNKQILHAKIIFIIFSSLLFFAGSAAAQTSSFRLQTADSLFKTKRYTQSMEHYRAIFATNQYTPAMLLKMAYIEEGLGQAGQALFYLDLYFDATNDQAVLNKMEELAGKYNLEGYKQTDAVQALSFYQDFRWPIGLSLMALAVLLLSIAFVLRHKKRNPVVAFILLFLVLSSLGVHSFLSNKSENGIVAHDNTVLMDGPSPGAGVVSVVGGGHRVEILGRKDVWVKIQWQGATAYIRDTNLLTLTL
jgi:uncharacterized protein YgiM (DUF1202 family)